MHVHVSGKGPREMGEYVEDVEEGRREMVFGRGVVEGRREMVFGRGVWRRGGGRWCLGGVCGGGEEGDCVWGCVVEGRREMVFGRGVVEGRREMGFGRVCVVEGHWELCIHVYCRTPRT